VALGIVDHLRRRSATADSSCGEFARFKLYEGYFSTARAGTRALIAPCADSTFRIYPPL